MKQSTDAPDIPRTTEPRNWSIDRLRAGHADYTAGERTRESILCNREYHRRYAAARAAGRVWPPTSAPPHVRPPIGPRLPGDPSWTDDEIRAAERLYRKGVRTPEVYARFNFGGRLRYRRRRAQELATRGLQARQVRFLEDVAEMADAGESLTGAAARLGRSVNALERALYRHGARGRELFARLRSAEATGRAA
jgi:hypothetical protein